MPDALTLIAIAAVMLLAFAGVVLHHLALRPPAEIAHEGASPWWSPSQELALVPVRPLDLIEAEALDDAAALHAEFDRVLAPVLADLARVGHAGQDTCEISREDLAQILADAGQRLAAVRDGT